MRPSRFPDRLWPTERAHRAESAIAPGERARVTRSAVGGRAFVHQRACLPPPTASESPTVLAQELTGVGVDVSNVRYTGTDESSGRFEDADTATYGFEDGVALSTGWVDDLAGPNSSDGTSRALGTAGDADLTGPAGYGTADASVLEFDFVPAADTVFVSYVFASEEHSEFANEQYNDVFAFFVNGTNCAITDDGAPVSVNTINGGNPKSGSGPERPDLYRDNRDGSLGTEADGLTVVLVCDADVRAGQRTPVPDPEGARPAGQVGQGMAGPSGHPSGSDARRRLCSMAVPAGFRGAGPAPSPDARPPGGC